MDIFKIIRDDSCIANLVAKDKEGCLRKLSDLLSMSVEGVSGEVIYNALAEREKLGSTGFEDGVAIPHAKIKGLDEFAMCIAVSRKGVDFGSIDRKKAHLFFTVIGPVEKTKEHLQILAQISRISRNNNARREILNAKNPVALKEAFVRYTITNGARAKYRAKSKLLMIVLYEKRFFDDILELFLERGIRGVNVIESAGIKDRLSNIPLFSDFLNFLGERSDVSKTIMAVVPESELDSVINGVEEIMGDLDKHTGAMVMALDIPFVKGTLEV